MKFGRIIPVLLVLLIWRQCATAGSVPGYIVQWGVGLDDGSTSLSNIVQAAAGSSHGLALEGGAVFGWGWNLYGQATGSGTPHPFRARGRVIIDGLPLTSVTAVAAGRTHSLALKADKTVVAWGTDEDGEQIGAPPDLSDVAAISAGWNHDLALRLDGTIAHWGRANRPPAGLSNVVAISAGRVQYGYSVALLKDGSVVEWPVRGPGSSRIIPGLSNVIAIATGWNHRLALRKDGTVFSWGADESGQAIGHPALTDPFVAGGTVVIDGQVLSDVVAIAAGNNFSLALRSDGTVAGWGRIARRPFEVPTGLSNIVAISAGENSCIAITTNAAVAARFMQQGR